MNELQANAAMVVQKFIEQAVMESETLAIVKILIDKGIMTEKEYKKMVVEIQLRSLEGILENIKSKQIKVPINDEQITEMRMTHIVIDMLNKAILSKKESVKESKIIIA